MQVNMPNCSMGCPGPVRKDTADTVLDLLIRGIFSDVRGRGPARSKGAGLSPKVQTVTLNAGWVGGSKKPGRATQCFQKALFAKGLKSQALVKALSLF